MSIELPPVIVLAAGKGGRAGAPKGLIEVEGRPWLEVQLEALAKAGLHRIVVVLGSAWDEHVARFAWVAAGSAEVAGARVVVVRNPSPERGPFSSLQEGIGGLPQMQATPTAYVLPVDVPCPPSEVFRALEGALTADHDASVPLFAGRGGHPVLCSAALLQRLATLDVTSEDARLDVQLRRANVARTPVSSSAVLANWNTREDWPTTLGASLIKT